MLKLLKDRYTDPNWYYARIADWLFVAIVLWIADRRDTPLWVLWQYSLLIVMFLFIGGIITQLAQALAAKE